MHLTKHGHACVRVRHGGTTLVIDPGGLTEPAAWQDADAVLITHEHFDHFDKDGLAAAMNVRKDLQVWTNAAVAEQLPDVKDRVNVVAHGDAVQVGGIEVHVYGQTHAPAHLPPVHNIGFRIGGEIFHPGDAFTVPEDPTPTLLLPAGGPWLKATDMLEYVAEVTPRRVYSIHEGLYNDVGLRIVDAILGVVGQRSDGADVRRLPIGESVALGGS